MIQGNYFFQIWFKELFLLQKNLKELNVFFLKKIFLKELIFLWLKGLIFFKTQRIEPLFDFDSKNWTFFEYDWKNWTSFWVWFKELNLCFEYDSTNRSHFLNVTQKIKFFVQKVKKLNFFENSKLIFLMMPKWLKELDPFFMTQRIEPFLCDSKNWTLFFCMTQRIEPCVKKKRLKESNSFERTHGIEPLFMNLFSMWLKELKSFFNMTRRIEPFLFSNMTQRIEIFLFSSMTRRIEPCFKYDSKNCFWIKTQRFEPFSDLTQCIDFFLSLILNMAQRIEFVFLM